MTTTVTLDELAKHTARDDAWIAVDGHVYDVSGFIETHPGEGISGEYLIDHAGQETSSIFEKFHDTDEPFEWMEDARGKPAGEATAEGLKYVGKLAAE